MLFEDIRGEKTCSIALAICSFRWYARMIHHRFIGLMADVKLFSLYWYKVLIIIKRYAAAITARRIQWETLRRGWQTTLIIGRTAKRKTGLRDKANSLCGMRGMRYTDWCIPLVRNGYTVPVIAAIANKRKESWAAVTACGVSLFFPRDGWCVSGK